jgi:hypothetical protein
VDCSLAGNIGSLCVGIAVAYLSQFVLPKIKILYWLSHNFMHSVPMGQPQQGAPPLNQQQLALPQAEPQVFKILTHSITIQNFGRQTADWVEIVHRRRPDFFQLFPSLNYTEGTTPAGEHVLRVESLASKNWFTIQFLSYINMPEFLYIKSPAGFASPMNWMPVRKFPQWVYGILQVLILIGSGFCAYWLVRGAIIVFRLMHH